MVAAMRGLRRVAEQHPDVRFLIPMHRNPIVRAVIEPALGDVPNVVLTEPMDYHEFTHAMGAAHVLLTDSGGVQEEAPSLGKPVLVMRDTTERPEAVTAGTVRARRDRRGRRRRLTDRLLDDDDDLSLGWPTPSNPYGDGRAAPRCVAAIAHSSGWANGCPTSSLHARKRT